jgi:hypothetical protein
MQLPGRYKNIGARTFIAKNLRGQMDICKMHKKSKKPRLLARLFP